MTNISRNQRDNERKASLLEVISRMILESLAAIYYLVSIISIILKIME